MGKRKGKREPKVVEHIASSDDEEIDEDEAFDSIGVIHGVDFPLNPTNIEAELLPLRLSHTVHQLQLRFVVKNPFITK